MLKKRVLLTFLKKSTSHWWVPFTRGHCVAARWFLWCQIEQSIEQTAEFLVIWEAKRKQASHFGNLWIRLPYLNCNETIECALTKIVSTYGLHMWSKLIHDMHTMQRHFYTPVWKTGRIMPWQCPSVRLSVCPSVRPSVRPRFPDFSSTCFEISIWNLVYAFSRWHDMSSLSCITIGSIWPSLQPKVGQTYFLQSWPHKSR